MKNKNKNRQKISLKEIFGLAKDRAQSITHSCAAIHVNSIGEILIENCKAVVLYTENEICFDMDKMLVRLKGDNILMNSMEKSMITVQGRIFNIEFMYNKER